VTVEHPMDGVEFVRSSFCSAGACVEVGQVADGSVAVRDSKDPCRPALIFSSDEWAQFVAGVRAGDFDRFGTAACHPRGQTRADRVAGS
jgi:hypothetical protein